MRQENGTGWRAFAAAHGITDALRGAELVARAALDDTRAAFAQ